MISKSMTQNSQSYSTKRLSNNLVNIFIFLNLFLIYLYLLIYIY